MEELIQRQNEWHTCPEAERCARGIPLSTECMNLLEGGGVSGVSVVSGGGGGGGREERGYTWFANDC